MADKSNGAGLGDDDVHLDLRPLLRIGGWGAGAIFAAVVAVFASLSENGSQRAGVAVASLTGAPSEQSLRSTGAEMLARADSEREVRRLSESMRILASDRDRLANRLALLEHNLDDLTGSIARQSSAARPPVPSAGNGNGAGPAPVATAPDTVRAHGNGAPLPAPSPAPAAAPRSPPPQAAAAAPSVAVSHAPLPPLAPVAAPAVAAPRLPAPTMPSANVASPVIGPAEDSLLLSALPLIMPKEPAPEVVPLPRPGPVAMLQAYANAAVPAAPAPVPTTPPDRAGHDPAAAEFAVDLGAAPNLHAVRALWDKVRVRQPATLDGLRPLVNIRDGAKPGTTELRLVVGPLANPQAVARVCAALIAVALPCQPAVYDGQRLVQR